jgi:hypothetical protein
MNTFWAYFWPIMGSAVVIGTIAGSIGFRRPAWRIRALIFGAMLCIALALVWHGPLGAADRLAAAVDRETRLAIYVNEIPEVHGHIHHGPLTRQVLLSGPADDFQRAELVKIIGSLPGVSSATFGRGRDAPLIVEAVLAALAGFAIGLLFAYVAELRRRYNAQWNW